MRVLFVYPDVLYHRPDWEGYFYVGVASLSTVLEREGHQRSLFHITRQISKNEFIKKVRREDPDLIGFSSTSHMFPLVKKFVNWLVETKIEAPVICGGIHPTIAPEESLEVEGIDMICRGEGEAPLSELCKNLEAGEDISNIQNLWIKRDGDIIKNPLRPLLDDLDSLPFPDRSIFDYPNLYQERERRGSFLISRGCPYDCTYCCNHLMREIYNDKSKIIRYRSVDNVIAEIKEVIQQYPFITTLVFDDDILFLKKNWSQEFAEKYSREIGLSFACNARANLVNEELVDLLKRAGCYLVKFGLESGNEKIANKVLKRNLKNDEIRRAFSLCKEAGLITESFNMVGIPYETPSNIVDTVKLNSEIAVDQMHVSIFQPYQGTQLAELCEEKGFVEPTDLQTDLYSPSSVKLDTITPSQVLMFRDYFKVLVRYYQVLQRLPFGSKLLITVSDNILIFEPVSKVMNLAYIPLNYLFRKFQLLKTKIRTSRSRKPLRFKAAVKKG